MKGELSLAGLSGTAAAVSGISTEKRQQISSPLTRTATMIDRNLSLVEFYWRVLDEAVDHQQPLLERIKFLAIVTSLIDEFYMIRAAGLKQKAGATLDINLDGLTAAAILGRNCR